MNKPRYPIYIISKGRHDCCLTARFFIQDKVDFHIVIEPQEKDLYLKYFPEEILLILPFSNLGMGGTPARNWCWDHAKQNKFKRHWIFDDNIHYITRLHHGKRIRCNANTALSIIEDFTDRYENIAISGLNYDCFAFSSTTPFILNCHVYSSLLIENDIPQRWRCKYNEDTDLCLQVVTTKKLCTVLFNAFAIKKKRTMTMKGGNTDQLYKGNGRLKMARSLEAIWPEYVKVVWKFGRPQHHIKNGWKDFIHPLIKRQNIDWNEIAKKIYDIRLVKTKEIKSRKLKKYFEEQNNVRET